MQLQIGNNTHTFSVPQPNVYPVGTARLAVKTRDGRPIFSRALTSFTRESVTFSFELTSADLTFAADCGECEWKRGISYSVWLSQGGFSFDPPTRTISEGPVAFSGQLPCANCGGENPPGPPTPPPDEDDPYGPGSPDDPGVLPPEDPGDVCLPTDFVMPAPAVPTPCDGGSGLPGGGTLWSGS